jgi:predicted GNAT superfamily acetyltransferase
LIVTKYAGGFTLGAFDGGKMVGFVLSVAMFKGTDRGFYSHMTAVDKNYQNYGIGARLKWAQRERALQEGVGYIKWTFQPVQARNAFFNLERLGATINVYQPNFYGTDYSTSIEQDSVRGVDSDRLFADWYLDSPKVVALSNKEKYEETGEIVRTIEIPNDWNGLVVADTAKAIAEQERIKREFQAAFAENLIVKGFERSETNPRYLLYK